MKKYLFAALMLLTVSSGMAANAQNQRKQPKTELADTARQEAIEAFSDTTAASTDSTETATVVYDDEDVKGVLKQIAQEVDADDILGMLFALAVLFIIFILSPIGIIIAVFYFINKSRRDKYKLAQMAMQNGQPIPDELLRERVKPLDTDNYTKGIRQTCLGTGLMFLLGLIFGPVGVAIGALVLFIGLGKIIIAKTTGKPGPDETQPDQDAEQSTPQEDTTV